MAANQAHFGPMADVGDKCQEIGRPPDKAGTPYRPSPGLNRGRKGSGMEETTFKLKFSFDGLPDSYRQMSFTSDEVSHLKDILNKFEPTSVEKFIGELEHICREQIRILAEPKRTKTSIEQNIADLLKTCKKTARDLQRIAETKNVLIPTDNFNFTVNAESGNIDIVGWAGEAWWYETSSQAIPAATELLKFIECLEARPKGPKNKSGRPASKREGFIKEIKHLYEFCFSTKATIYSLIFQDVVSFSLEATGHDKHKDATRRIKAALSKP